MKKWMTAAVVALIATVMLGQLLVAQTREPKDDCMPYTSSALRLSDEGVRGWLVSRDDGAMLMLLDNKQDADTMMRVFKAHAALCYVGRENKRPDRQTYVHMYWK